MDLSVQAKDNAILKALLGADNDARKKAET